MRTFITLFIGTLFLLSCNSVQTQNSYTKLSAIDFAEKIKKTQNATIIDVRTFEEFNGSHIPNAKNIDWLGVDFSNNLSEFDKSKPIFVYCLSGGRSAQASEKMKSLGFNEIYELEGGIMKWSASNLPETVDKTLTYRE